ncbi:hypothetical protein B2J93_7513 [Marssonina coronariae]|uniref:Auxiliary Activity family 9 catalytic domain-containing protein n=1 Tax=Diplocarpon coronariae TaxID=2795749 RepID=A0A218Z8B6_9HELO|nr:hypothetical protein B2J93_7513 [Marssonina coronariae]
MSFPKFSVLAGLAVLASKVSAHGTVSGVVADGVFYPGYSANYQYMATQPVVVGWSTPQDTDNGFIAPDAYADPNIICHRNATNAQTSATVKAGGTVELQWTTWPSSHHGPVLDYLADCGGDCKTVDKTTLKFFKIDEVGLVDDTTLPGKWGSDTLEANNNTWSVTIPKSIAPGNYVLRHEIIALHSAGQVGGAQNYPQCINLEVTGSGTDSPAGTLGTALYKETDPGIEVNIYATIASYALPGPALYTGAASARQGAVSATAVASSVAATSGAAGAVTPAATQGITSAPASSAFPTAAPNFNSTLSTVGTMLTKSACEAKRSQAALFAASAAYQTSRAATTDILTSFADTATVPTGLASDSATVQASSAEKYGSGSGSNGPEKTTSSSPSSNSTSSGASTSASSGSRLGDPLAWLSAFYSKHSGPSYTDGTLARRHARDVAGRAIDDSPPHGGAQPSGLAHPSHHHHHHNGSANATSHQSGHAHHSGPGGAKPTGIFLAGSALPSGKSALKYNAP